MSYSPSAQMYVDMRRREGSSLKVYEDSKGLPTIGIGRHHGVKFGDPDITPAIEQLWLRDDLQQGYMDALQLFPELNELDVVRRESLIDLAFNMGIGTLEQFIPFIDAVNKRNWPSAYLHLLTNMRQHLTPYLTQTGIRAVDVAGRIRDGLIPDEFKA
jgi:GH24 family phage-related lysozyme (muramidase)